MHILPSLNRVGMFTTSCAVRSHWCIRSPANRSFQASARTSTTIFFRGQRQALAGFSICCYLHVQGGTSRCRRLRHVRGAASKQGSALDCTFADATATHAGEPPVTRQALSAFVVGQLDTYTHQVARTSRRVSCPRRGRRDVSLSR